VSEYEENMIKLMAELIAQLKEIDHSIMTMVDSLNGIDTVNDVDSSEDE